MRGGAAARPGCSVAAASREKIDRQVAENRLHCPAVLCLLAKLGCSASSPAVGARSPALARDPRDPRSWLAGSDVGGAFFSEDDGASWSPCLSASLRNATAWINAITFTDKGTALIGSTAGVFRGSRVGDDGCGKWAFVNSSAGLVVGNATELLHSSGFAFGHSIKALAAAPAGEVVWAGLGVHKSWARSARSAAAIRGTSTAPPTAARVGRPRSRCRAASALSSRSRQRPTAQCTWRRAAACLAAATTAPRGCGWARSARRAARATAVGAGRPAPPRRGRRAPAPPRACRWRRPPTSRRLTCARCSRSAPTSTPQCGTRIPGLWPPTARAAATRSATQACASSAAGRGARATAAPRGSTCCATRTARP